MRHKLIAASFFAFVSLAPALAQIPTANASASQAAANSAQRRKQIATLLIAESLMEPPLASDVTGPGSAPNREALSAVPAQAPATPPDPKYPVKIRILYCRLILGTQDIRAVVDGKNYFLASAHYHPYIIRPGTYFARIVRQDNIGDDRFQLQYEILFDGTEDKTEKFDVVGEIE
jgi:hypothetical protein